LAAQLRQQDATQLQRSLHLMVQALQGPCIKALPPGCCLYCLCQLVRCQAALQKTSLAEQPSHQLHLDRDV
jgi:hypothetical protein